MKKNKNIFKIRSFLILPVVLISIFALGLQKADAAADSILYFAEPGVPDVIVANKSVPIASPDFSLDAVIEPGVNQVSGAELHVTYDHTKFRLDSITAPSAPSNCTTTPKYSNVLTGASIDNAAGTASITVGVCTATPAVTIGTSTVATFAFHVLASTTALPIAFDGALTFATGVGEGGDVLTSKNSVNVTVTAPDTTPPVITVFTLPASPASATFAISSFTATDNTAVTTWMIKETATNVAPTAPISSDSGWQTVGITGTTSASIAGNVSSSTPGTRYFWAYVKDAVGNVSAVSTVQTVTVPDTIPPVISGGFPSGTLTAGTTQTIVSVTTDENANCKYSTVDSSVSYGAMTDSFTTGEGTTSHSFTATGLVNGSANNQYWIRCQDLNNNSSGASTLVSFSVANSSVVVTSPVGGQAWHTGEVHNVTWTASDVANVKIYIYDSNIVGSGNVDYIIPDGNSISALGGSYAWTVGTPHAVLPGSNYRIRVDAVDSNGNVLLDSNGAEIRAFSGIFSVDAPVVNNDDNNHKDNKKEVPVRHISDSQKNIKFGQKLTQRGKKFSKSSIILLYFGKPNGGFYEPMKVMTAPNGSFLLKYIVKKPKGRYGWYALDPKTGKKSKTIYYRVK